MTPEEQEYQDYLDYNDYQSYVGSAQSASQDTDPSFLDRLSGIGKTAALATVKGGINLARGLNAVGEYGNRKIDEWFPETSAAINRMLPDAGVYALPSEAEYKQASKDITGEIDDTTERLMPQSGPGRYAYMGAQGAAELAPKLAMGPAAFAGEAGLAGGLDRLFSQTDSGKSVAEAAPYAIAGGAMDAAVGYLIPKTLGKVLGGNAITTKNLAKELAVFEAYGLSQTAAESLLKRYLAGDETALEGLPEQVVDALFSAPFTLGVLKGGQIAGGAAARRLSRPDPAKTADNLESKIAELQKGEEARIVPEPKSIAEPIKATMERPTPPQVEPVRLEDGTTVPGAVIAKEPAPKEWIKNVRDPESGLLKAEKSLVDEAQQVARQDRAATQERFEEAKAADAKKKLVDSPVYEVAREEIATRPELMQFKSMSDKTKGTNESDTLEGAWDDNKAGNILLWEPLNPSKYGLEPGQKYIIANGHHRFEFGERLGRPGYNTQILREADGVSPETAKIYAAEINIADGKGTVYDQVKLLRNSRAAYGENAALEARDRLGSKGRQAATIAFEAERSLLDSFVNQQVTPKQAEAIAKAAPLDDGAQRVGIEKVTSGEATDPLELEIYVRGFKDRIKDRSDAKQGTLLDMDDSAMLESKALSALIKEKKRGVNSEKTAIAGPATRPDLANKSGVMSVPDAVKAREQLSYLKQQQAKLETITSDPEQMRALREELRAKKKGEQQGLFGKKGQRGAVTPDALIPQPIRTALEKGRETIERFGRDRALDKQVEAGLKDGSIVDAGRALPRFEKMLRGDVSNPKGVTGKLYDKLPDTAKKASAAYHKWTTFVRTAAERSPEVKRWYDASKEELKINHVTETELLSKLQPYYDLVDDAKVNSFLLLQRRRAADSQKYGKPLNETDANLKAVGFSPEEIAAIRSIRTGMDAALDQYKRVQLETAKDSKDLQELDSEIESLRAAKYVPFGRFGEWRVDAKKGEDVAVHFEDSKKDALRRAAELKEQGYESQVSQRVEPKGIPYRLPNELTEPKGFKKHLIPAKLTAGENQSLKKSIGEYVVNLAKYSGFKLTAKQRADAFETLQNSKQAKTYEWLSKVDSDFHSPTHGVVRTIRNGMYQWYLRFSPSSAIVNLTQPWTVTYPLLSKETNWSALKTAAAYKDVAKYITTKKTGDAGLDTMIARAEKEGLIGDTIHKDWLERARYGKPGVIAETGKLVSKLVPDMFSVAERLNRLHAMAVGYKAFKGKLQGDALYEKVTDFVDQSQFQYGKINSPLIARGGFAAPMTFRLWLGNYLSLLGRSMHKGDYAVAARMLGTMAALGGGAGFPFVKDVFALLESQDQDPRKWLKDNLGESLNDYFSYGLAAAIPEKYRPNITGKVGVGEMVQDIDKGNVLATAGRAVLGATADPILRTQKAVGQLQDGNYGRALETMLPEGLPKGASKLVRATRADPMTGKEAGLRSVRNEPIMTDVGGAQQELTGAEKAMLVTGFQPTRLSEAYKRQHSAQLLRDRDSNKAQEINSRLAMAIYENDKEAIDAVIQDAVKAGIKPDSQSVKERLAKMLVGTELPNLKRAPKRIKKEMLDIYEAR